MGRKRREPSPDEDDWSDMLYGEQMDVYIEALRCVDMSQTVADVQTGVSEAACLVVQLMQPAQFVHLVAAERGGEVPPADCGLKQFVHFKHRTSNAVGVVITAVLQGKVRDLEHKIEQRRLCDAQCADVDKTLAAAILLFQHEMTNLQQPGSAGHDGDRPADMQPDTAAAAAAAAIIHLPQPAPGDSAFESGAAPAAAAVAAGGDGQIVTQAAAGAASTSARQHGVPAVTPSPGSLAAAAAAAAAGARDAAEPPAKRLKTDGKPSKADAISPGQQAAATGLAETAADAGTAAVGACIPSDAAEAAKQKAATAAAKAASGKPGSVVVIPGARSNFLAQAGISDEAEEDWQQFCQQEAAEAAAAAAAREEQHLTEDIQAQGGLVLPPEGYMAATNTHRMFKNRMTVTAFMTPEHVDDKKAGVKAHLDEQLFRYLEDHQVILMSYELLQCDTAKAFLHPEPPPMLTVQAVADVVTFEPTPGDIICGVVRKLSHNSITLLVLGCISVAIERPFIPADWGYDMESHCWVPGGDYSQAVSRGDLMTCMLLSYPKQDPDQEEVLFNLEGSLLTAHTGLCSWQWPRQQRLRQLLAAQHGQGEAYGAAQEHHWQQLQQQLRQQRLTRRKLTPVEELGQGSDSDEDIQQPRQQQQGIQQQQQQGIQQQHNHVQQPQQGGQVDHQQQLEQKQHQGSLSKDAKRAQKEAEKQAKRAEKTRLKAERKAEKKATKSAEKAARKEARQAEKAAAKAQAKAEKRAKEQQGTPAAEQPAAKKQKKQHGADQQQQAAGGVAAAAAAGVNGHAAAAVQQLKHKTHKNSSNRDKNDQKD